jgi:hypothetical protein
VSAPALDSSASYAAEVARMLWPAPWQPPVVTRRRRERGAADREAYVFPSARRPRLLVPVDVPGSSRMLRRLSSGRSGVGRPVRSLVERSMGTRAFALTRWPVLRVPAAGAEADSIERHLSDCLGTEVRVGVLLGSRRVNQKPVLTVFDAGGELRGYAKVGHNDLTRTLVRREADSLAVLNGAPLRHLRVPRVLHHGRWGDLEVLLLSPLADDPRQQVPHPARVAAMTEVAHLPGVVTSTLATSSFWLRLRGAAERDGQPHAARVRAALAAVEEVDGAATVSLGGWHGDWGRWNMGMADGVLSVWDWERFDPDVPLGFDGVHFAAQSVRPGQREAAGQETRFLRSVPATLAELGVPTPDHDRTLRLYLLEIAVRYAEALTHGSTPALQRRTDWVLSLLERLTERTSAALLEGRP